MSSFKLVGSIRKIGSEVQVTEKFRKLEFVITDGEGMYPQNITFQLTQDKCSMISPFKEGQQVEVSFNLDGKEYIDKKTGEEKFFNSLNAWKIESVGGAPVAKPQVAKPTATNAATEEAGDDLLPF